MLPLGCTGQSWAPGEDLDYGGGPCAVKRSPGWLWGGSGAGTGETIGRWRWGGSLGVTLGQTVWGGCMQCRAEKELKAEGSNNVSNFSM